MELFMKDNGSQISNMDLELRLDLMDPFILVNFLMGEDMVKGPIYDLINLFMKVTFQMMIFMDKALLYEVMGENMLENKKITNWMEQEFSLDKMENNIEENTQMIKNKDMEYLNGLIKEDMKECDIKENNMEEELILCPTKLKNKENGRMV